MAITDPNEIQILVKQTVNPTDLSRAVLIGDQKIIALTNRPIEDWSPQDNAYGQIQLIGNLFAAWNILMGWDKEMYLDKAKEMHKAYMFEVEQFNKMFLPDDKGNPYIEFGESEYTHYKLNPDYVPFTSSY